MRKAGSNRARGRAGWLRLARHGMALPAEGSAVPVRCGGTWPGLRGGWVGGCSVVASRSLGTQDLGCQRSRAWQISMLETISFKTWTCVIKTLSILQGDGHRAPQSGWGWGGISSAGHSLLFAPMPSRL